MLSNLMSILRILMMVMGITKSSRSTLLSKKKADFYVLGNFGRHSFSSVAEKSTKRRIEQSLSRSNLVSVKIPVDGH